PLARGRTSKRSARRPSASSRRVIRRRRRCTALPALSRRRRVGRADRRPLPEAKPRPRTTWWTRSLEPTRNPRRERGAGPKGGGVFCFSEVLEQPDVAGLLLRGEAEATSVSRGNRISYPHVGRFHQRLRTPAKIGENQLELIFIAAEAGEEHAISISAPSGKLPIATRTNALLGHLLLGEVENPHHALRAGEGQGNLSAVRGEIPVDERRSTIGVDPHQLSAEPTSRIELEEAQLIPNELAVDAGAALGTTELHVSRGGAAVSLEAHAHRGRQHPRRRDILFKPHQLQVTGALVGGGQ